MLVGALGFVARGHLVAGASIVTLFALTDLLDGAMARMRGGSTRFGAFLDSSMDRVADGAVFGAVAYWLATAGRPVRGGRRAGLPGRRRSVSYVKARAEGLGMTCNVGIAERTERLIIVGVGGDPHRRSACEPALRSRCGCSPRVSIFTVGQRMAHVYRQAQQLQPDRPGVSGRAGDRRRTTGGRVA